MSGVKLTPAQMLIAADMCDARRVELGKATTDDEMAAAEFIWDRGIFYTGPEGCDAVAKILREKAALSPNPTGGDDR